MTAAASIAPPAAGGLSSKTRALVALAAGQAAGRPDPAGIDEARAAGATPAEIAEAAGIAAALGAAADGLPLWEEG
ncbi:carboxymuconolactone decarboxylase family protein [Roseomonas sp. USHLN139]|uniref:carboxymuconolactone decarboxylase family protein n=1 Tax=Roseomonas sp. USHLN139 TaxID=3081298 RepID=UPI003B015174